MNQPPFLARPLSSAAMNALLPALTPTVTFESVMRYLSAFGINTRCDACGHESWFVSVGDNGGPIYTLAPLQPHGMTQMPLPIVYVECQRCGYLRLFNHNRIFNWSFLNQPAPASALTQGGLLFGGLGDKP